VHPNLVMLSGSFHRCKLKHHRAASS